MKYVSHEENNDPEYVRDSTTEFSDDTYKGQAVVVQHRVSPEVPLAGGSTLVGARNSYYHLKNSWGMELVARSYRAIDSSNGITFASDYEFKPVRAWQASLLPGEAVSWIFTQNRTIWTSIAPPTTASTALFGTTEFLSIEDVTLGDGTIIKNACKLRDTDGKTGAYSLYWMAAGLRDVKFESYTPFTSAIFKLQPHADTPSANYKRVISKILVAP